MKKKKKGQYGYLTYSKKTAIIRTAIMLAAALSVYITGWVSTGTNKNLLTIVAVLGCLPACKSAVGMIMLLRAKGCPEAVYEKLRDTEHIPGVLWDMYFTSYEKNYEVFHMQVREKAVIGLLSDRTKGKKEDVAASCEKHLHGMLAQNGYKDVTVKIFTDLNIYQKRLKREIEDSNMAGNIEGLLKAISL